MVSDISSDESLQVTPVKDIPRISCGTSKQLITGSRFRDSETVVEASPVFFENAHSISTPISENGIFPIHELNFSPPLYADYTQYSPMFQLGQDSPTRNEFEGFENDTLRSDPPTPINNCFGRQMPREYAPDSDPLVNNDEFSHVYYTNYKAYV